MIVRIPELGNSKNPRFLRFLGEVGTRLTGSTWLDRQDFKFDHDAIKIYFTSLSIELLIYKLTASFWKSTEIGKNTKSNPLKNFTDIYIWCAPLLSLIIYTFTRDTKSTVLHNGDGFHWHFLFKSNMWMKWKDFILLTGGLHYYITV